MTSSNSLKKLVSISAAILLAVGGSLVAAQPASAAVPSNSVPGGFINAPVFRVGAQLTAASGTWNGIVTTMDHVWYSCVASSSDLADPNSCTQVNAGVASGMQSTTTYTPVSQDLGRWLRVSMIATNSSGSSTPFIVTSSQAIAAAPTAPTVTGTAAVGSTLTASEMGSWYYCNTSHAAGALGGDCTQIMGQMGPAMGLTLVIPVSSNGQTPANLTGKFITSYSFGGQLASATLQVAAPAPPAISGTAVVGGTLTVTSGRNAQNGSWIICTSSHAEGSTIPMDCVPFGPTANAISNGLTLPIVETVYHGSTAISTAGKYIAYGDATFGATGMSATKLVAAASVVTPPSTSNDTVATLPVWQAPLVKQVPNLSKSLTTNGGQISLKDDSFAGLKSVTVGGKPVNVTVGSDGSVTIPVPAGQTGSADLTLTFDSGTITIINGIKYVAPTDVAKVAERPVAIAAGSKKITEAIADQIRQAAFANMTNTNIQCVAYSANNSAKAKAAAELTAVQACGIAAKANPALKIADVTVIVDKAKARKAAVGIKVYKN